MTQVTVRPATLNDLEECVGMSIDFMNMTPYKDKPLCTQSLAKVFIKSVQDGLAFVAEDDGDICGMLIAHKVPAFFDNDLLIAQEIGWWVDEEYRDTRAASMLIKAFENEAQKECTYTVMSLLATSPKEVEGYLKHIGYIEKERSYFKENY
jgi:hypothetical protein